MAITGLEAEGTRGRCAILGDVSTTNQSCLALNGTDRLCVDFLFVFYKMWGDYLAFKYCQGSKQQSYTAQIARSLPIYFPPSIEEQQKIAEALRDIDLLIEGLKQKIAKKRAIKEGAMQQLLTGKKRLAGFSEPWVERRLGEVGAFISGSGFPILFQGNKTGELPFYKVSDFSNNGNTFYLNNANNYISHSTAKVLSCNIIPAKSIIFAKIGAAIFLERKRIAMTDCCIDNNMMALIINNGLNVNYINYVLQTIQFGDLVEVTALPSLGSKQLKRIKLFYPQCIIEQQAIAQILTDIDNEIAELEQKQKKYTTLKQGAMQKLLTGQIRL